MIIDRSRLLEGLLGFSSRGNGVIVGPPGVGKTYLLRQLRERLRHDGLPHLLLPIDQLGEGTDEELQAALSFTGDFIEKLRVEASGFSGKGLLLFDAFDAARSEVSRRRFLGWITRSVRELSDRWTVLVSVRTYDAKKSQDLLSLFGSPVVGDEDNRDPEIPCRHFAVPVLAAEEVETVVGAQPILGSLYQVSSQDLRELLRIPFNLWLLEKIAIGAPNLADFSAVRSEVQLLGLFWGIRVRRADPDDRESILTSLVRRLVSEQSLSTRKEGLYQPVLRIAWEGLLSDEVLHEVGSANQRVAFTHNILFDYAVSLLIIEDEPEKLIDFLGEDASRPLFLRPSLVYYFTRLWHSSRNTFWNGFWYLLPSKDPVVRLVTRLLPAATVVTESRSIDDVRPLIERLTSDSPEARGAILLVLRALQALGLPREELWLDIIKQIADHIYREFAWEVAQLAATAFEAQSSSDRAKLASACGSIARSVLAWVWHERNQGNDKGVDSLGAIRAVPLVAKTFGTNPLASRQLLEPVLSLTSEAGFPIEYLSSLCSDLDKIWPHDPEFAELTYVAVFRSKETSQEPTRFGGYVLPLRSSRRQDFELCRYQLIEHFAAFLATAPSVATKAALISLNEFILDEHVVGYLKAGIRLADLPKPFNFRGSTAQYIQDASHIWAEGTYRDSPLQIGDQVLKLIGNRASSNRIIEVDSILDLFRDHARVAYWWRRLLQTGAQVPLIFAGPLFELCIAPAIQTGGDTLQPLGAFLEAAASEFGPEHLRQIENSLVALAETGPQDSNQDWLVSVGERLIARLPRHLLVTEQAKRLREQMASAGALPSNEPLVSFTERSEPYSEDEWLREKGADLSRPENDKLRRLLPPLAQFVSSWQNQKPTTSAVEKVLPDSRALYQALRDHPAADQAVLETAWSTLAAGAQTMARSSADLDRGAFEFVRDVLLDSAQREDPELRLDHAYESAIWSPAARNEAAQGLPWIGSKEPNPMVVAAIERLAHDPVPTVRFLLAGSLHLIARTEPEAFWRLVDDITNNDRNRVVQQEICRTLTYALGIDEERTLKVVETLLNRAMSSAENPDVPDLLIDMVIALGIVRGRASALAIAQHFIDRPLRYTAALHRATVFALNYITPVRVAAPESGAVVSRAIDWCSKAIAAVKRGYAELRLTPEESWPAETQAKFRDLYSVMDFIIVRLYFDLDKSPPNLRKNFYLAISPLLDQILALATDRDQPFVFAPTAHHFMQLLHAALAYDVPGVLRRAAQVAEASRPAGYTLDGLAVSEVVSLVEEVLADHGSEARSGETLANLEQLLNLFAEVGWPDALRLIWRLDEVFR